MEWILFVLGVAVGSVLTGVVGWVRRKRLLVGALKIAETEPGERYLFLELNKGVDQLVSKKQVLLKVDCGEFSQK